MATDMFLKIDDVRGESVDSHHAGEIDIIDWEWGLSQPGSAHAGSGAGSGRVRVQDITLTKYCDRATPNLIKMCCSGKHFKTAVLTIRKAAGSKPVEYVKLKMADGIVSFVRVEGRPTGDRTAEILRLNFASYTYEYVPQAVDGSAMATIPASWNISTNAPA